MADMIRGMEFDACGLGAAFDRLGRLVNERETARRTESAQSISIIDGLGRSKT